MYNSKEKKRAHDRKYMNNQKEKGLCIFCKNKNLPDSRLCESHFFKSKATAILRDRKKWEELKDLFYAQNKKCFITGKELVLGINASLDHLEPISKSPELASDVSNVRWVDREINLMKRDTPILEFIETCHLISKRHEEQAEEFKT
ncbi:MAG: hypothetical protein NT076_03755 [Candidatus Pacearchaeota archaeon]|nr:hypothetical protein [Candidatus Pacearchaeota archaeon]